MGSVWISPLCIGVSIILEEIAVQLDGIADLLRSTKHLVTFTSVSLLL